MVAIFPMCCIHVNVVETKILFHASVKTLDGQLKTLHTGRVARESQALQKMHRFVIHIVNGKINVLYREILVMSHSPTRCSQRLQIYS